MGEKSILYPRDMTERLYTPNQAFYVRDALEQDALEITDLLHELAEYCGHSPESFGITSAMIAEDILRAGTEQYATAVETATDTVVGVAHFGPTPRSWGGGRGLYLEDLIVRESHRDGRGIGSLLLASVALRAIQYAPTPEQAFIRLDTGLHDNDETLGYYRRQGFDDHNINLRLFNPALGQLVERYVPQG